MWVVQKRENSENAPESVAVEKTVKRKNQFKAEIQTAIS